MRIVNPSFGIEAAEEQPAEAEVGDRAAINWQTDPIALFSNSKPNCREVLEGLKQHLGESRPTDNIEFFAKDGAGQPSPAEIIDQVAGNYRGAILGLAD